MATGTHLEQAQASIAKPSKASVPDAQHTPNPSLHGSPPARYLSRLAAHKEVTEELAGRAPWVSGHKGKLAVGWAPGGVEYSLQGMCHQEHLRRQQV